MWYNMYTNQSDPAAQEIFNRTKQLLSSLLPSDASSFQPQFLIKVTWQRMAPAWNTSAWEENTFQAVLATDYLHTYVLYLYEEARMTWSPVFRWVYNIALAIYL